MNSTFYSPPVPSIKRKIFKLLTLGLFFVLPSRLTKVFVSLSIISLIFSLRNERLCDDKKTVCRIGKMLNLHMNNGILLLPHKTCQWYWSDRVLDSYLDVNGQYLNMRDMVSSKDMFLRHRSTVINELINTLPKSIVIKMNLNNVSNKLKIKHNITNALMYA